VTPRVRRSTAPSPLLAAATVFLVMALTSACTPRSDESPDTTVAPTTIDVVPSPEGPLVPPELPDPDELAASWIVPVDGFSESNQPGIYEQDALTAIGLWLPDQLVVGTANVLYEHGDDLIVVVSLVPRTSWRGDPGLVPALAALDSVASEVSDGVYRTETDSGLVVSLWSNGDGLLAAASLDPDAATSYLVAREEVRTVRPVWAEGDCLYLDPDDGLPWAPVTLDTVVPCSGPHNAEVIRSVQIGTDATVYDEEDVSYQRNYDCDRAYATTFGPQRDRTPELVTYMPDEAEFARGDRYLACVVQLVTEEGPALITGRLAERNDLVWIPVVGTCYSAELATMGTPCDGPHVYEFVGTATVDTDAWPDSSETFREACEPLIDGLEPGNARIDVFPTGLYPYAFETGDREVRCFAFATRGEVLVDVVGSFMDRWRVLGDGGIPA
jgi:Septum formation